VGEVGRQSALEHRQERCSAAPPGAGPAPQDEGGAYRKPTIFEVDYPNTRCHLAGVEPNADLHVEPLALAQLRGIVADGVLHVQGGIARPHGMIFMGERRAEQGHDAVAHHLVDDPLVAVHRRHHALQHRVEELPRLLGVAVGQQLHRALQIGEEDCHVLALAFKGGPGGEDFLGQMAGRITQRRLGG
jgi:hypothetical protein